MSGEVWNGREVLCCVYNLENDCAVLSVESDRAIHRSSCREPTCTNSTDGLGEDNLLVKAIPCLSESNQSSSGTHSRTDSRCLSCNTAGSIQCSAIMYFWNRSPLLSLYTSIVLGKMYCEIGSLPMKPPRLCRVSCLGRTFLCSNLGGTRSEHHYYRPYIHYSTTYTNWFHITRRWPFSCVNLWTTVGFPLSSGASSLHIPLGFSSDFGRIFWDRKSKREFHKMVKKCLAP